MSGSLGFAGKMRQTPPHRTVSDTQAHRVGGSDPFFLEGPLA